MYNVYNISILQIIILISTGIIQSPEARLRMQIPTEPIVELFCHLSMGGFMSSVAFNICLLLLCALYGFLTRALPDNFNESRYIFISVTTTSFMWMVFLPTYFNTFYAYHQASLLAFCLILNATITLLCLYIPKIYAIYIVDADDLKYGFMPAVTLSNAVVPTSVSVVAQ